MICLLSILYVFQATDTSHLPLVVEVLPSSHPLVGSPWSFTLEVANPNLVDLEIITLEKPCSCVELDYPRDIPAQARAFISGSWLMAQPGKQTLSLDLYGLLNQEPYHEQLEIVAIPTGPIQFSPKDIDFGLVKAGIGAQRTTELILAEGFRIVAIRNPNPEILTIRRKQNTLEITLQHQTHQKLGFETRVPVTVEGEKRQTTYLWISASLIP